MENDPLAAYLDALARDDCYRVDAVLKTALHETTEVVFFVGANAAELGPFVRKRISSEAAMGDAYGHLLRAQRTQGRFRHLPRIYDVHAAGDEIVVVMEYVCGHTLRDEVYERDGSLALAAQWFPLLCDGVMELHECISPPLIHRDLKPSNIVVGDAGLTIIDFGIARTYRDGASGDTTHFGTRSYAPPEQFGYGQTDVRSDVYALGMLLYYLVTERDPSPSVAGEGFAGPEVPPVLRSVLCRACAFDPAARFQTVRELKTAFLTALAASVEGEDKDKGKGEDKGEGEGSAGAPGDLSPVSPSDGRRGSLKARVRCAFSRISAAEIAGLAWDCVLVPLWLLFMAATALAPFDPAEQYATWPLWLRMVLYWLYGFPFFTGFAALLIDCRIARRAFPALQRYTLSRRFVLSGLLVGLGVVAVIVVSAVASALGYAAS